MESKKEITEETVKEIGNVNIQIPFQHVCSLPSPSEKEKNQTVGTREGRGNSYSKQVSLVVVFSKVKISIWEFSTEIRLFLSTIY